MPPFWRSTLSGLLLVTLAAACTPGPTGVRPTPTRNAGSARPSAPPSGTIASLPPGTIGTGTTPILQPSVNPAAPILSNNGSNLIGKVKAPAQLISDKGVGLVTNGGGNYRLLALSEAPVPGAEIRLKGADGQYVKNDKGEVLKALTDINGDYKLPFSGNSANLLVEVTLPGDKGAMTALVPRGESTANRTVDVNFTSTLVMTYILDQYVKGDPKVLDKLPADVELTTRAKTQLALEGGQTAIPEALTTEVVIQTVNVLRQKNPSLDDQLETVKKLLIAGLSDQANGFPANDVETDAVDVAIGPDGTIHFAGITTLRIWKKDAAGKLAVVAGSGNIRQFTIFPPATQPAPGDGGPAVDAMFMPAAIEFLPDGRLLILDRLFKRIRQIDTSGKITTYAAHDNWEEPRDMVLEPDGSLLVANHCAIYRVKPDKTISLIAGEHRALDQTGRFSFKDVGDGGPPSGARFADIQAIAAGAGKIYVYDFTGRVRRISGDVVEPFAGTGTPGYSGDGGPATSAQLHRIGGLKVKPDGTVLITDSANHRLRQVVNGTITTVAGTGGTGFTGDNGPALQAAVTEPRFMDLRPDGTLYFTSAGFVRKLADGTVSTPIGGFQTLGTKRPADQIQFVEPNGVEYEADRHALLVSDARHLYRWTLADNMVECIASSGAAGEVYTSGMAALKANLVAIRSPWLEPDGTIRFIAVDYAAYISRIHSLKDGVLTTLVGGQTGGNVSANLPLLEMSLGSPQGQLIRIGDTYYYTIRTNARIRSFQLGGTTASFAGYGTSKTDGTLAKDFDFLVVTAIAKSPDDKYMYVGEAGVIYRIDMATTQVTKFAGSGIPGFSGDGGPATEATMITAEGMAFDAQGRLYFSDNLNARIRRIDKDGVITSVAGAGTGVLNGDGVDNGMLGPTGLAFDKDGNLYVADMRHNQIKIIRANQL